jgi:hypothetical protein
LNKIGKSIIDNLDDKLGGFLPGDGNGNNNGNFTIWYGKPVIPMDQWIRITNHKNYYSFPDTLNIQQMIQCFPNEYNYMLLAFGVADEYEDIVSEWWSQYAELHHQMLIWRYGPENYKKMLEEESWQRERKAWDFHESNMGHGNDYTGGCTSLQCVPTCEFYGKSAQNLEALQLLQESGYKDRALPAIREPFSDDSIVYYDADGNDVP